MLCGKGIYARGLAQEALALAVSLAPSSQLIDLLNGKGRNQILRYWLYHS